jgi:alpha-D-xyloside xylohydrolase
MTTAARTHAHALLLSGALVSLGCSSSTPPAPAHHDPYVVTFGAAKAVATLTPDDGGLTVQSSWATPLLRAPAGRSLIAVRLDPDDPTLFHDPETTRDADFIDVGALAPGEPGRFVGTVPGYPDSRVQLSIAQADDAADALALSVTVQNAPVVQIALRLASDDGAYVGLGERFDHVDAKGTLVPLAFRLGTFASGTNETHVPVPFFANSRGYGVAVDTYEAGAADVASGDPGTVRLIFEGAQLDARLYAHRDPLAIVAENTRRTGLPRLPPKWAYAPMQWRNEGMTTAKVQDDLTTTRAQKIPGGCLWIDNPWQGSYDDSTFAPAAFADPKKMIDDARALGFEVLVWSTPYLEFAAGTPANRAQQLFVEAKAKGLFVTDASGNVFDTPVSVAGSTRVGMLDLPSPAASQWWATQLRTVTSLGTAGFKLDFAEDLVPDFLGRRLELNVGGTTLRRARTRYPGAYHQTYRGAFQGLRDDAFIVGRAGSAGGQAFVDAIWPGDLDNDFSAHASPTVGGLPASVCGMINLAASGYPTYAADTGGFRGGRPSKEHFVRWAEVNAHSMIFQNGGGGPSHAPWTYDAETVDLFRGLARRHMDLYPYLRALSVAAHTDGTPTVRALPLAFPAESMAIGAHADDEYLLGPDLLVAPVMADGATSREVYVPSGAWTRWSTGERLLGPKTVTQASTLGDAIVLVREGAILPLLAADVDTLGDATATGVVTAKARAKTFRAYALPYATNKTFWEEGTRLDVNGGTDKNQAIVIAFVPSTGDGTLTLTMDLANRTIFPATWTIDGAVPASVADEASVDACTSACMFIDATKKRVTLHFAAGGSASGSK